jgi:hypothetical protein
MLSVSGQLRLDLSLGTDRSFWRALLVYRDLLDSKDDEYICKTARIIDEAKVLVEEGFEYVTTMGEVQLFRKRK